MYPPLRQAEWIKFIGLLIGEEEKANVIFDSIKAEYNTLLLSPCLVLIWLIG